MKTKHTKEYAKKLATEHQKEYGGYTSDFIAGYMKAIKETAVPDLLKACISALKDVQEINKMLIENGHHGYILMETELDEVIKKATT